MKQTKDHTKNSNDQSLAEWIVKRAGLRRRNNRNLERGPSTVDTQLDHYIDRVKQLLIIANQQASELASERKKRRRAERELAEVRDLLKETEHSRRQTKRTLRRASRELNSLRCDSKPRAVIDLREKIEQIHEQYSNELIKERTRRARVEANLNSAEEKIKSLQRSRILQRDEQSSINDRVLEERERRRKAEKASKRLKQNLRYASRSLNSLRSEHKKCRRGSPNNRSNGNKNTPALLEAILPNLTVVRDNVSYGNASANAKQMLDDLTRLNDNPQLMRGERVGGAKKQWFEIRPTLSERIYYRKSGYNSQASMASNRACW